MEKNSIVGRVLLLDVRTVNVMGDFKNRTLLQAQCCHRTVWTANI